MSNKKEIISKHITLLNLVSKYTNARSWEVILIIDLLICLLDIFNKNKVISDFLKLFGINPKEIINYYWSVYNFKKIKFFQTNAYSFSIDSKIIKSLDELDEIKNMDLFILNLFLDILYEQDILEELMDEFWPVLENLEIKRMFDYAHENKLLKKEFGKILNSEYLLLQSTQAISQDEYSDFDVDNEEELEEEQSTETRKKNWKLVLDTFWTNLVELANQNKLEPMVGREKELNEVIYTLLRKTKSNPLLIWEAWVGKTAIIEWLAQKIADNKVPTKLKNKKIYNLDMGSLIAWTKFRGEFEARLKSIIEEAINPENNIILFIDEIHTMVWAWNQEWWADTANILKPHLARWELNVIWATTYNEYKKYIEKDPALSRRFQLIKVNEPLEKDAIKLLEWIKYRFEDFHWVNIKKEAIENAVKLSKRYILDKHLPDKAIDLIDEACSRKSSISISKEKLKKITKLENNIKNLENKIEEAVTEQDYFTAADLKEEIKKIKWEIHNLQSLSDTPKDLRENITSEDIQNVIAEKYWVSNQILNKSELDFLLSLKKILNKKVIWQEQAVEDVVNAIIRNKISPIEKTKPIGSFLFLWASWVGKTYLAQLLAEEFFQDKNALIKINMSEYNQEMSASKLTGSAPWYIGYEEGWQLTESIRKRPYSVVLFDEIEKGSSQVLNILLQILDQGYLEDNKGRKIDFKNTIIILTSNLWAEYFWKEVSQVWFSMKKKENKIIDDEKKEIIMKEVKNLLPIELINRFDKVIFFNNIDKNLLTDIFKKYYKDYKKIWKTKKWINIPNLKKDEVENIVNNIHKEWAWVRWIEKYIYNELENKIIEKLINK